MKNVIAFSFFVLLITFQVNAQSEQQPTGSISGRIINYQTKLPIIGATVALEGTKLGSNSKTGGKYQIKNIIPGIYNLRVSSIGYETVIVSDVEVATGRSVTLDIEVKEKAVQLEAAEVVGSLFIDKSETVTSTQNLSFEDVRRAPGVQEDIVKATALLPGVSQVGQRNDLLVRGGAPFENLYMIDNIEVQNVNHFGSQGSTGGPLSIINIDNIKNVEFSSGGFGAKYGDKLSSITNIYLRNGNEDKFGGKLNLSATGFGLNLEGPLGSDGNSSYIFSVRRSYLDILFKALGLAFIPQYWDFQGKVNYRIDDANSISYLGLVVLDDVTLDNDNLDNRYKNSSIYVPNQKQFYNGVNWQHVFENGYSNLTLANARVQFETFQQDSNLVNIFNNISTENEYIARLDFNFQLNKTLNLNFGNQLKYASELKYDLLIPSYMRIDNNGVPQGIDLDTNFTAVKNFTYFNANFDFDEHQINLGARLDYFSFTKDNVFISPRFSYIYDLTAKSSLLLSAGRYYQSPSYIWLMGYSSQSLNPIIADQAVFGYKLMAREDLKIQVETYYKKYSNYPARVWRPQSVLSPSGFEDASRDIPFGIEPLTNDAKGQSFGLEIFAQKKLSEIPLYGLVSLTISQTKFTSIEGIERNGSYDTRAILNISGGYRLTNEWEIGTKFRTYTGVPTTPFTSEGKIDFSRYNEGERLPLFHSLDLRVDKKWNWEGYSMVTYVDIQNIYGRKNVSGIFFNRRTGETEYQESIGVFPTIGVSLEF